MARVVIQNGREAGSKKVPVGNEHRKHPRVSVCVPVSCVSLDADSRPLDQNMGVVRDVSQTGVGLEANFDVRSGRLALAFVDLKNEVVEGRGSVVCSRRTASGTFKVGVELVGTESEILGFVKRLVTHHHYTKHIKTAD